MGVLLGLLLGFAFVYILSQFIKGVLAHRNARKQHISYIVYLCNQSRVSFHIRLIKALGLSGLFSTRLVEYLTYIFQLVLSLIILTLLGVCIYLYFNGYSELFDMRW